MFVMTLRKGKLKKVGIACACGAVILAAAIGVNAILANNDNEENLMQTAATVNLEMTSAEDLIVFLQSYGVEADVTTATVSTVTVPKKWDDSFVAFNDVIKESNLTLEKCKGKQVDKWSILIPSKSTEDSKMYAIVLVQDNTAVAAYLLEKPTGEVLPLSHAAQTAMPLTQEEVSQSSEFGEDAQVIVVNDVTTQPFAGEEQQVATEAPVTPETQETGAEQQNEAAQAAAQYDESLMPID